MLLEGHLRRPGIIRFDDLSSHELVDSGKMPIRICGDHRRTVELECLSKVRQYRHSLAQERFEPTPAILQLFTPSVRQMTHEEGSNLDGYNDSEVDGSNRKHLGTERRPHHVMSSGRYRPT
jgi:hypothetical protein